MKADFHFTINAVGLQHFSQLNQTVISALLQVKLNLMSLLIVKNISKSFASQKAVREVSFTLNPAEIVGLAGESGCGKTTVARLLVGLEKLDTGEVLLNRDKLAFGSNRDKAIRRKIQMVFQNTLGSFNPRHTIASSIAQPLLVHQIVQSNDELKDKIHELLALVGLDESLADRFPHQISGGQIQRAAIARAIACKPDLLIADEPTSALDVSIRAQILHLLKQLRDKTQLSCLIVSHDLLSLGFVADRILVMKEGAITEEGPPKQILSTPKQTYTQRLIAAIPSLKPEDKTFEKYKTFLKS